MTVMEKLEIFTNAIEAESPERITESTILRDLDEWDSMGVISTIAMLATKFNKTLSYEELNGLNTVSDILVLMETL